MRALRQEKPGRDRPRAGLLLAARGCAFLGDRRPPLLAQLLGPRSSTLGAQLLRRALGLGLVLGFLARGDARHPDGSADHVGGALLTLGALGHQVKPLLNAASAASCCSSRPAVSSQSLAI